MHEFGEIVELDEKELRETYQKYRNAKTYFIARYCGLPDFMEDKEGLGEFIKYKDDRHFINIAKLRMEESIKRTGMSEDEYISSYAKYDSYRDFLLDEKYNRQFGFVKEKPDEDTLKKIR